MKKEVRERVFQKYSGHCAYCGKVLSDIKAMQVDHLIPKFKAEYGEADWGSVESEDNLMPACRRCNHYKRAHDLETFRTMISEIPKKLYRDNYIFKVGEDYGIVAAQYDAPVKFYFERLEAKDELKSCPFCGSQPILTHSNLYQVEDFQIKRNNVDCWIGPHTSFYSEKATAIEAWNTRSKLQKEWSENDK